MNNLYIDKQNAPKHPPVTILHVQGIVWRLQGNLCIVLKEQLNSTRLGRFTQPDTIIPDMSNSQVWNRYSYVNNSPIMYVDSSGQMFDSEGL